jgi:hypothetical protein
MLNTRWLFVLLILSAVPAQALLLPETGFDELVAKADGIVVAKVIDKRSEWNAERTRIYTHYTVEVERTLKGFPVPRLKLTELGGQVGELAMEVSGVPGYEPGEQAVIFLHAGRGRVMTLHWFQGKFPIREERVGVRTVQLPGTRERAGLDDFEDRVREVLARQRGGRP